MVSIGIGISSTSRTSRVDYRTRRIGADKGELSSLGLGLNFKQHTDSTVQSTDRGSFGQSLRQNIKTKDGQVGTR